MVTKRFTEISEDELAQKRLNTTPSSTRRANEKARRLLDTYVSEKGLPAIEYGVVTAAELDAMLAKFSFEARTDRERQTIHVR